MNVGLHSQFMPAARTARREKAIVEFLRNMVVSPPCRVEKLHAVFVDDTRSYLADLPLGQGADSALSLRMRDLFRKALSVNASGMVIAHNHPSGMCRPSHRDIEATQRIHQVAEALDIQLVDHLIFTRDAVYSMRAGEEL